MNTQTVQTNPLLSGNTASPRANAATAAQEDGQFQQALARQIERQASALPPTPAPAAPAARRAEAAKPAAPAQPQNQQAQQARPAQPSNTQAAKPAQPAPAAKPASQPANASPDAAHAARDSAATQQTQSGSTPDASSNATAANNASSDEASAADAAQQQASDPIADMLMLMASLNQPAATTAAATGEAADIAIAGAAQGAAAQLDPRSDTLPVAKWPGIEAGVEPPADMTPEAAADALRMIMGKADEKGASGPVIDNAAMAKTLAALEARIAQQGTSAEPASVSASTLAADGSDLPATALQQGAANTAQGADAAPQADFQATLAQAKLDAGKAGEAAAREAAQAVLPGASSAQANTAQAPAGAANAQAAQAVAGNQLHARVGSQGWDHQLGQKVVWMLNGGEQSATLTLNPPDLGPLQVVLSVSNDQASVAFTAAQPEVREALEQALPKLRDTMGEAGITLGDASVSAGSQEQKEAFEQMAANSRGRGVANGQNDNPETAGGPEQHAHQARRSVLGAVDTFA